MADEQKATREPTPMCDDDTHYWLQGVNPPPDGSQCQCGERSWPVEDSALLRGMVQQARLNHPLPWRVEHDWGVSVEAATGRVFFGTAEECQRIVALAEQHAKDSDAFGKEFEAMMQSDADSARTPPEEHMSQKPEIICLSGSTRFLDHMAVAAWELEKAGNIVLSCHLLPQWYTNIADHLAEAQGVAPALDELHLRKIDLASRLHVINVGGYIGASTAREIAYAEAQGKPITYHDPSTTVNAMRALEGNGYV